MPRQLIYTSVPRGLTPGQSGYCTVARSRDLREALIPRIEKLSYYTPEADQNPVICAHRILDVRGTKFHVLTRIVDAGLDFTKRRSFLAHHLILEPTEINSVAEPAEVFLEWDGWLNQWRSDPSWLEDHPPLRLPRRRESTIPKCDVWISGESRDRENFLAVLVERGADWHVSFTNCFQPGDHPDDFDIKAAWPNTPGHEAATRFDAVFTGLNDLRRPEIAAKDLNPPQLSTEAEAVPPVIPKADTGPHYWPYLATALIITGVVVTLSLRPTEPPERKRLAPVTEPVSTSDKLAEHLDVLLPDRATWLTIPNVPAVVPPLAELMRQLQANEVFTKDLSCTLQTNLLKPAITAVVVSDLETHLLRFRAVNSLSVDLFVSSGVLVKSASGGTFAIEIPQRFRLITIAEPIQLPLNFLNSRINTELDPLFAGRLGRIVLPQGAQLALRPLIELNGDWIDPLEDAAHDLGIVPATVLDLAAVHARASQVIREKEAKLQEYQEERTKRAKEHTPEKIIADATQEQAKAKDRLKALELAIPKAAGELEILRAKAAAIPKDTSSVDRFALFLCLSNVNTEIFRFSDKP